MIRMLLTRPCARLSAALCCVSIVPLALSAGQAGQTGIRPAINHSLPPLNGHNLSVEAVEVTYPPGASSPVHSHPCPVVVYVIEGSVRMQVNGESMTIYHAGDSFYEAPNGVHAVSANASKSKPAKFLATFVCDHETPLTVPVP